ncbi:MAG: multicopper oxidase domain-containing protein [Chloroflexi bacterium]|nr:multicopper oxidase domain-containing protein [Chloroflexota bacterium]
MLRVFAFLPTLLVIGAIGVALLLGNEDADAMTSATAGTGPQGLSSSHEGAEGLVLAGQNEESVTARGFCTPETPVRSYEVLAIKVDITLNRYLDHDPQGRMYVLAQDLARVRAEEAQNARARGDLTRSAVSLGLQGDAIQPLTLRVNQGECLRVQFTNALEDEPASLHLHGSSLYVAADKSPAIAANPRGTTYPGERVLYEWMVPLDQPEETHYFHSHGDTRVQTGHGLFGAVIVEHRGSLHLDPRTGGEAQTGWDAIIQPVDGPAFREFVLYYHEIGHENYQFLDKAGAYVPLVDPFTDAYRPGARALNYRSEPFLNRLRLQESLFGEMDKSSAYSSYVFGDPATPILRSYLGDPVKERVVHGGSEVFHVHHVHGGSIRWPKQPGAEEVEIARGLDKLPPLLPTASERIDSQSMGPSESFDVEHECNSGGCQQSAGDFLIHCHIGHHYFAGMWGLWRVYNTAQDGAVSTDTLQPLLELPDRQDGVLPAVPSTLLPGRTVDWQGLQMTIAPEGLAAWVERQLPPQGKPKGYDASVLDWEKQGDLYLNERETEYAWPGYASPAPGTRVPILFDPLTGKLAYPFLRPHLGKRPPFAPGHGPAPYLDPITNGADPPMPGDNGPGSICPTGTQVKSFVIHAITLPLSLNDAFSIVDPGGQLFVLKSQEEAVRASGALKTPLVIRANAQEDCVDILLKSELENSPAGGKLSKVNLHIHFAQFDVQASDGVVAGFNYEQSVRPFREEGEIIAVSVPAGADRVTLASAERFHPGTLVGVGMDQDETFEIRRIKEVLGDVLVFEEPLSYPHEASEIVSTEFVRYRWYPDVQFGTAYFHDHVDAINSWRHGLYGAFIAEPPGSTYRDPVTGQPVESGPIADILTTARVSADVMGSFRELVLFLHDENPLSHVGRSTGSAFNLRVEPLGRRGGDPAALFSSQTHGDPATPVLQAYVGDPIILRALAGSANEVHTLHVDGHWFRVEPHSSTSPPVNTVHLGISERYDLALPAAGGVQGLPGDYLFYNGRIRKLAEGSWGILRVLEQTSTGPIFALPGRDGAAMSQTGPLCPEGAPQKQFAVSVVETPLPMLRGATGKVYVLAGDKGAVLDGTKEAEPLVLRAGVGDCITVALTNETPQGTVTFHVDMLAYDPHTSGGIEAGYTTPPGVAPGETSTFTYYAHPDIGETVTLVRDWGDVLRNPGLGLYGAIIIGPAGAVYRHPVTGEDISDTSSWQADVYPLSGAPYRSYALFFQDEDDTIGTHRMPYTTKVQGVVGINYQAEPLEDRRLIQADSAALYRAGRLGDPHTPLLQAYAGDVVKLHVIVPWSEQNQVFTLEGHRWPLEPGLPGTNLVSSVQVGALEAVTLTLADGAGGPGRMPGDYLYGDHREPYREAGLWGIFRVLSLEAADGTDLRPLIAPGETEGAGNTEEFNRLVILGGVFLTTLAAAGLGVVIAWRARRHPRM